MPVHDQKLCFILGIAQRSGTNFLFNLLKKHPECAGPGPIWEDFFLKYSDSLVDYSTTLLEAWNPDWEVETKVGGKERLLQHIGAGIEHFLRLQLKTEVKTPIPNGSSQGDHNIQMGDSKILLTKTPTVEGLDNFFSLFPNAHLILLVRDGRAVVESGVRSFHWDYEQAMFKWRERAQIILEFKAKYENSSNKFLLLKFEDIVSNQQRELTKIFNFLDVDPDLYDYDIAKSMGVSGSSELRKQTNEIHWHEVKKKEDFNPLDRFSDWSEKRHERFNWIAGTQMKRLGYELYKDSEKKVLFALRNKFKDHINTLKMASIKTIQNSRQNPGFPI